LWLSRRYEKELKPGALFAGWLVLAGIGRTWIEFFRPDQPKIEALGISYSAIVASLMAISGAVMLLARYKAINLRAAETWEEEYSLSTQPKQNETTDETFGGLAVSRSNLAAARVKTAVVKKASAGKAPTKPRTTQKKTTPQKKSTVTRKKPSL